MIRLLEIYWTTKIPILSAQCLDEKSSTTVSVTKLRLRQGKKLFKFIMIVVCDMMQLLIGHNKQIIHQFYQYQDQHPMQHTKGFQKSSPSSQLRIYTHETVRHPCTSPFWHCYVFCMPHSTRFLISTSLGNCKRRKSRSTRTSN